MKFIFEWFHVSFIMTQRLTSGRLDVVGGGHNAMITTPRTPRCLAEPGMIGVWMQ